MNRNSYRTRRVVRNVILHGVLIFGGIVMVFPFVWMVFSSFKPSLEVISIDFHLLPQTWTVRNYVRVFEELKLLRGYANSLTVSALITVSALLTATLAGYLFSKIRFFGREVLFFLVLASVMVPPHVVLIPLYALISAFRWVDTYQGLVFPFLINAFGVFLMRQFMRGIPDDLVEAARIDGASDFRIYFSIILPLVRSALAVLGILVFLWSYDEFLWPLVTVHKPEMMTLPLLLGHFTQAEAKFPGESMAACTLVVVPVLVVYAFFQQYFVKGISMTGLKG
jgi:multiple sugar transport system permease protein